MKLGIINTACANLASLEFALKRLDFSVFISDNIKELEKADKLFLPGVGTAYKAMLSLEQKRLVDFIKNTKKPLLGICLGMQILGEFSQELNQKTLGIMSFETLKFSQKEGFSLPHMGWNDVTSSHALFKGLNGAFFYFVHSYCVKQSEDKIATCTYSENFIASIAKNNFYGVQFHPERSGEAGEMLLRNFVKL